MVVQREQPVRLQGFAAPGVAVHARCGDHEATAQADDAGRWRLQLPPLPTGGPYRIEVQDDQRQVVLEDVLCGEVWLGSGQSNMQMLLGATNWPSTELEKCADPLLRLGSLATAHGLTEQDDATVRWAACDPVNAKSFSAVAFHFGRQLRKALGVPVGMLVAACGHTPAEAWMSRSALEGDPALRPLLGKLNDLLAEQPEALADYAPFIKQYSKASMARTALFNSWYETAKAARAKGEPIPPEPPAPCGLGCPQLPTVQYNHNIAPLVGLPLRGFIWYQGETNAIFGSAWLYRKIFPQLIRTWRQAWGLGPLPFVFAQIANHADVQCDPAPDLWAEVRESQLLSLGEPNTAMAVTIDIGETQNIHPTNKQEVGRRLALAALAKAYGRRHEFRGPLLRGWHVQGFRIQMQFDHAEGGLVLKSNRPDNGLRIAGPDRVFVPAQAEVRGEELVVFSERLPRPVAVRYAWTDDPACSLYNQAGLPASPFRTDDWPLVSQPK